MSPRAATPTTASKNGAHAVIQQGGTNGDQPCLSTWTIPKVPASLRQAGWRSAAHDRYLELADDLTGGPKVDPADRDTAADRLCQAAAAFEIKGLRYWWANTAETEVLAALDLAAGHLVPVDKARLAAYRDDLRLRIDRRFRGKDTRRATAMTLLGGPADPVTTAEAPNRANVQQAAAILHSGSLEMRTTQRTRRNVTVIAGVLFVLAAVLLAFTLQFGWGGASLAKTATETGNDPNVAPQASPWIILLFGAIGGLLSVVPMLKRADRVTRAMGAWTIQALFKVASGALLALVAVTLVQTLVLPIIEAQEASALVGWALLFGYSQDLVTKALDERLASVKAPAETDVAEAT